MTKTWRKFLKPDFFCMFVRLSVYVLVLTMNQDQKLIESSWQYQHICISNKKN